MSRLPKTCESLIEKRTAIKKTLQNESGTKADKMRLWNPSLGQRWLQVEIKIAKLEFVLSSEGTCSRRTNTPGINDVTQHMLKAIDNVVEFVERQKRKKSKDNTSRIMKWNKTNFTNKRCSTTSPYKSLSHFSSSRPLILHIDWFVLFFWRAKPLLLVCGWVPSNSTQAVSFTSRVKLCCHLSEFDYW